jgi:F0F1-type ATP synthase membrane subunit c/vacuolar-type H+-ATPase subunit K
MSAIFWGVSVALAAPPRIRTQKHQNTLTTQRIIFLIFVETYLIVLTIFVKVKEDNCLIFEFIK